MVLDYVAAEKHGIEAKLRKAYEDVSKLPEEEKEAFVLDDEIEESEVKRDGSNNILQNLMKDDEQIDWLDSNFAWAFEA